MVFIILLYVLFIVKYLFIFLFIYTYLTLLQERLSSTGVLAFRCQSAQLHQEG
nr:MAG TPA: hypothetical protein [Microviridae sp.]